MTRSTQDYLDLVAAEHQSSPKYLATVALTVDVFVRLKEFIGSLTQAFDLDTAIGVQLDAVGVRVGRSRRVPYALPGNYFSWDVPGLGWDQGIWRQFDSVGFGEYLLDDDTYRRLIRAKILANSWDGTVAGEEAILKTYFADPATLVFVSDDTVSALDTGYFSWDDPLRGWDKGIWAPPNVTTTALAPTDMTMTIAIAGKIPNIVDIAVLGDGLVGAKPEGVTVNTLITSVDETPIFGFDLDTPYIGGWDRGSWGVTPDYALAHHL